MTTTKESIGSSKTQGSGAPPQPLFAASPSVVAAMMAMWVGVGIFSAASDTWVPVPFLGYFRYDIAAMILLLQGVLGLVLSKWRLFSLFLVAILTLLPSNLPDSYRPTKYLQAPPTTFRDRLFARKGGNITIHDAGLSVQDTKTLVDMIHRPESQSHWSHMSMAFFLPYFVLGNSIPADRSEDESDIPQYSLEFGLDPPPQRRAHQSWFRLNYPAEVIKTQSYLVEQQFPQLIRPVIARILDTESDNVVFGTDLDDPNAWRLGLPGINIFYPNIVWDWIVNPHHDLIYGNQIRQLENSIPCREANKVKTILIPLTTPRGTGLQFWTPDLEEVLYEVGKAYSFKAEFLHTIRHFPYQEWKRSDPRITIQAFAVQCDDKKYYVYH